MIIKKKTSNGIKLEMMKGDLILIIFLILSKTEKREMNMYGQKRKNGIQNIMSIMAVIMMSSMTRILIFKNTMDMIIPLMKHTIMIPMIIFMPNILSTITMTTTAGTHIT